MKHPALAAVIALAASLLFAGTAEAQAVTPLDEEPLSLSVDGSQHIFDHAVTPATCSIVVDRVGVASCFELVTDWVCPSGNGTNPLSADALGRFSPTYNGLIANPVTPRAYIDTHCLLVGTRPQPVPAATIACKAGEVVAMNSAGGLVCAATPTVAVVAVAVPSFTG